MMQDPRYSKSRRKMESLFATSQNIECGKTTYYGDYKLVKVRHTFPGHDEHELRRDDETIATIDIGDFRSAEELQDRIDEIIAEDQDDEVEATD